MGWIGSNGEEHEIVVPGPCPSCGQAMKIQTLDQDVTVGVRGGASVTSKMTLFCPEGCLDSK